MHYHFNRKERIGVSLLYTISYSRQNDNFFIDITDGKKDIRELVTHFKFNYFKSSDNHNNFFYNFC